MRDHQTLIPLEQCPAISMASTLQHVPQGLRARVVIDFSILSRLLQLPPGAQILHAAEQAVQPGVLHLSIQGTGWPTRYGDVVPQAGGTITEYCDDEGRVFKRVIDWGFPTEPMAGPARPIIDRR